ncbi:hypothetical protein [Sanguibacter suaedae]|uniref:Uncharacterized protein n=1 Tax=Sanguibacter suaedae TaxID=2795737 RepID=A0A934IBH7_9MICO|nr:hypothetical protein [Sanguibacter suaedae]MBI9115640.1 hypothetical protein [Sanguibacter suaedae]
MSRTDRSPRRIALGLAAGGLAAIVFTVSLWLLLHSQDSSSARSMGNGVLVGGAAGFVAAVVGVWRAYRRRDSSTTADRVFAREADERDLTVWRSATSAVGIAALPLTATAAVVLQLGVPVAAVMAVLLISELLVLVGAFLVADRRL